MSKYHITFVGTGMIGGGLAVNAMLTGNEVVLYDVIEPEKVRENIQGIMDIMVRAGAVDEETAKKAMDKAVFTSDLAQAVKDADFVQECIPERVNLKQSTYRAIQEITGNHAVIASSTSSLFPSLLQEGTLYPDRILVGHPYNPSYLLPLIEVCGGKETSRDAVEKAMDVYSSMGKVPIECRKEVKGFIVNKVSWNALATAKEIVDEGICSVEDMDKAIMYGPGMRMAVTGQLLTMSLGVEGGFREYEKKYSGKETASPSYLALADGIDEALANRPEEKGRTVQSVIAYRDKIFAEILKAQGML